MKTIFIAYNSKDKIIARFIYQGLKIEDWQDIEVFMDEFSILPHEDFKNKIVNKAKTTNLGIIVLSEYTMKSEYVPQEIGILLSMEIPKIYIALHENWKIPPGYENTIKSFPFYEWKNPNLGIIDLVSLIKGILKPTENKIGAVELINRATKLGNQGNFIQAQYYAEKAVQVDPLYDFGHLAKINNLRRLGQYENALKAADEGLSHLPNNSTIVGSKGLVLYSIKRFTEAITCFKNVVETTEHLDQRSLYYLACCYSEISDSESANKIFEECLQLNKTSDYGRKAILAKSKLKNKI